MSTTASPAGVPPAYGGARLLLITVALVLAPLVQVFDTATVSIALRHMQGELSATQDQIAWVITSYLITLTVFTPVWGVLGGMFGRKRLILISIAGFTSSAMLAGMSTSLTEILIWRAVQGFFGSALLPLGMSSMLSVYPREKLGIAMAWWGVGMMFGPVFGPTIGGYVTEYLTWRWAFYINLPIGIVAFLMTAFIVPRTGVRTFKKFNYYAFATLGIAIACLQFILDRGERYDWFESPMMVTIALIGFAALWLFLVNVFTTSTPFIEPVLFKDRDYLAGTVLRTLFGVLIFGSLVIMPPFIQDIGGYPPLLSGYAMAPRGAGTMLASFLVGYLLPHMDPRKMIAAAMLVMAATMWQLSTFTEDIDMTAFGINNFIQGLAFGAFMVPLNSLAFVTLKPELRDAGTSFYSLVNNIGRSLGVALFSSYLVRSSQSYQATLTEHIRPDSDIMRHITLPAPWSLTDPVGLAALERTVVQQAKLLAYIADYQLITVVILVCMPALLFMKNPHKHTAAAGAARPAAA
jgi:MFS transporter, DHA2 family, multidrug resistance protein